MASRYRKADGKAGLPSRMIPVFEFDELSDEGKEGARDWWRGLNDAEEPDASEYLDTLRKACKALGWELGSNWCFDPTGRDSRADIRVDDTTNGWGLSQHQLEGPRLFRWMLSQDYPSIIGRKDADHSCPFTGCFVDEEFLDPLRAFLKRPTKGTTLQEIADACKESLFSAFVREADYQSTDEAIDEAIRCNGYEFLEDGRLAPRI